MSYIENFFSADAADAILAKLEKEICYVPRESLTFAIYGKTFPLPRDKAFYGDVAADHSYPLYRYGGNRYPTVIPWSPVLKEMRDIIYVRTGHYNNHVVVNRYLDGADHIGLHRDKVRDFVEGAPVCTLSFGGTREFVLKEERPDEGEEAKICNYSLKHGSLFVLDEETNRNFKHSIKKTKRECSPRISLTYRNIKTRADANGNVLN